MFLLIAVGAFCYRKKYINDDGAGQLSFILTRIVAPNNIIDSFQHDFDPALGKALIISVLCTCTAMGLSIVVSHAIFRKNGSHANFADKRFCVVFTNCGFMGLPLLDALYGSKGLSLGSAFIMVNKLQLWTYGVGQLSRDVPRAERIRNTFINPGVISNLIGLFCFLTPFKLPAVPATAVSYLASLNTPIAMIAVGAFLAPCDRQVYFVSALRLLVLPLLTLGIFLLVPLEHTLRCSMLISAAAPVAMAASLFGKTYGTDYLFSTRATAVSTILSAITIPALVALCELLGG